jgi:hypothetical protein
MRFMNMRGSMIFAFCAMGFAVPALGADNPFDGTYSGTRELTKGSDASCPNAEEMSITVQDGRFTFTNSSSRAVLAIIEIAPNGAFSNIHQGGKSWSIFGKVADGVLEADAHSSGCVHHWSLKRS